MYRLRFVILLSIMARDHQICIGKAREMSAKKTILMMSGQLQPREMAALEDSFDVIKLFKEIDPEGAIKQHQNDIVGIISSPSTPVRDNLIKALPNLEIVAQFGVGVDNIDLDMAGQRSIRVTNTPDVITEDTADTALALFLSVTRRIVELDMYVRVGRWKTSPKPIGTSPYGKTVGIVGLGNIGKAIAKRLESLGCEIAYYGRGEKPGFKYTYHADLIEMARACDYLVVSVSGGLETKHLINMDVLEELGEDGYLINVSRGSVVDEDALVQALQERTIAGAGLDVYANEPNVPEELISMDHVVLLPHIGSATYETFEKMGEIVLENLKAHFAGDKLLTPVV